jgi:hypothetical protein
MFPEFSPQLQADTTEIVVMGKSFLFDFTVGDFTTQDGKLQTIEGLNALKVWIEKVLKTEKFKFSIYDTYGITAMELIMSDYPQVFIQAELQREITEALLKNTEIVSVGSITFTREKRALTAEFTVNSIYGTTAQEVIF